jgi:pSer/pThr/pTyr-binding forkhead associated (FHA) protein
MPRLLVTLSDGSEVTHELTDEIITLGRVEDNAIQIDDASVSSHHAELSQRGEEYILKDIGSTNGTRINGETADPDLEVVLKPGDRIMFGHVSVRYVTDADAGAASEGLQPLPAESEVALAPASTSAVPSNFTNASPFQSKKEKKDPVSMAVMALAVVALGSAGYAIYAALQIPAPQ